MAHFAIVSRILNTLRESLRRPNGSAVAEVGEGFMKCIEVRFIQGRPQPVRFVKKPIDLGDKKAAVATIKTVFQGFDRSCRRVRLNIPRHLLTVRFLQLPSVDDTEIKKIVKMESLKHVPYADEQVVAGHRVVEKHANGYSSVLIAVTKAESVQTLTDLFGQAGLVVEFVALGSEALLLWYLSAGMGGDEQTVLILNIDEDHIDMDVVSGDKLVFTRGVRRNDSGEISLERIVQEIRLSASARHKESGKPVDKILLIGPLERSAPILEVLKNQFEIPVSGIDPMTALMKGRETPPEIVGCSFAELLGLSLNFCQAKINLLSESMQESQRLESVKKNVLTSLTLFVLILGVISGIVIKKLNDERAVLIRIGSEFRVIGPQVKMVKTIAKQIDLINAHKVRRPLAVDLLAEVYKITPGGIFITLVECETDKEMVVRGSASSMSHVFKYVSDLEQSAYLDNVKVKYANKRAGQSSELVDFEIVSAVTKHTAEPEGKHADKKPN